MSKVKQQVMKRARILGAVMTKNPNIKVTVSGSQAYRIPGLINIPNGDFTDPEWFAMCEGWIDHELGHEAHTDQSVLESTRNNPALAHMLNIIEDIRMERSVSEHFKGAKRNLSRLAELAITHKLFMKTSELEALGSNPIQVVQGLCLYRGRSLVLGQTALDKLHQDAVMTSQRVFGFELTDAICRALDKVDTAMSTTDCKLIAQEILGLLKCAQDEQDLNADDESDTDFERDERGDLNSSGDNDSTGRADICDEVGRSKTPQLSTESKPGQPNAEDIVKAIENALSANECDGMHDFHKALAGVLEVIADEDQELVHVRAGGECSLYELKPTFGVPANEVTARRISGSLYQAMHKVLFDQVQSLPVTRNRGLRIQSRKISGVPAGNVSVFKHNVVQQDISAAITILVDASGSMRDDMKMAHANTTALAFALGLGKAGIAVEVIYYGVWDHVEDCDAIYTAKSFSERVSKTNFAVLPYGGTPTGEAMQHAANSLLRRPEEHKMMFIVTDGEPNDTASVALAREVLFQLNINVVPIGIGTSTMAGFSEDEFVSVSEAVELPRALKQAIQKKLFK